MKELTLHTRSGTHQMPLVMGKTIVAIAKEHKLSWGYACERGYARNAERMLRQARNT